MDVKRLEELMKERKITYGELSKTSGISEAAIFAIKSGRRTNPKIQTIAKLAKALGVKTEDLIVEKYK